MGARFFTTKSHTLTTSGTVCGLLHTCDIHKFMFFFIKPKRLIIKVAFYEFSVIIFCVDFKFFLYILIAGADEWEDTFMALLITSMTHIPHIYNRIFFLILLISHFTHTRNSLLFTCCKKKPKKNVFQDAPRILLFFFAFLILSL